MDLAKDYDDTTDYTELFLAVHNGDLNLVHSLFAKYSATETIRGRTLLHVAAARGHTEIAKLFTTKRDEAGNTPLHLSIMRNQPEVFNLLLEETNLNAKNLRGERPLHYAVLFNRPEFVKKLIENGAIIEEKDKEGKTPLYVALAKENVQMAEILFKHGAVLSDNDLIYMGPLRSAVKEGNFEMVKLLMVNGCNTVDIPTFDGSALKFAVSCGHLEILEYLMKNGVKSSETINKDKLRLFQSSIKNEHMNIFKYLVDVGLKTEKLSNILYDTISYKHYDLFEYVLTCLSKIFAKTHFKEKQLHFSIRMGQVETIKATVKEPTNQYQSNAVAKKLAVYIAAETGNEEILEILLKADYPVDSLFNIISAIHVAATFEHPRLVKLLLKAGADVNLQTEHNLTPLHFAATSGKPAVVKYLLENGADPTLTCNCSETPLAMAVVMFSSSQFLTSIPASKFERLAKVTELLIRFSDTEAIESLYLLAIKIKVLNITNSEPKGLICNDKNAVFRPEIVNCMSSYLSDEALQMFSERVLNESFSFGHSPELLHLMMDYNNSKSCCTMEIYDTDTSYKCKLIVICYSKNISDLLCIEDTDFSFGGDDDDYQMTEEKLAFFKLIVARLVLLTEDNHQGVLEYSKDNDLNDWREKCLEEKKVLKKTKINENMIVTFYDVLTKSTNEVAMYTSNCDFLKAIESSDTKFPVYADFLKTNVEIAEKRKEFMNECTNLMFNLIKKSHKIRISRADMVHIFQYLTIVDLRRFSAACSRNSRLHLIQILLFVTMDPTNDYNDTSGYDELSLAVHNGDLNLVQSLLKKHSAREKIRGRILLSIATVRRHTEIAKLFTAKRDEIGNTPLHLTIMGNQPQIFNLLLEESNVNAKNCFGQNLLHYAALYNRSEFAEKLIDTGAFIEVKDKMGRTPLYVALENGNIQIAEVLFQHGAVLSDDALTNMYPLRDAVEEGNFEMVKLLMVNGCSTVDIPTDDDSSLKLAVSSGRLDILEYLIKNGEKSSETITKDELHLFETSIKNNRFNILKYLVDIGVKTETVDDIFYDVINLKRYDMWEYLVKLLSTIYAKTHYKEKQLHFSIRMGQVESVKAIVNDPASEYISDPFAKKLAVYIAAETGNEEILENLLKAGYPVESLFKITTPLHVAATLEHPRLVKLLLKAGADVNIQTDHGLTPLHFAATSAQPAVVKFLLENGADPSKSSNFGGTPLLVALRMVSSIFLHRPTSILTFERLTKVAELLIRYSINETSDTGLNLLITTAAQMKVSSNNVEENNSTQGLSGQTPKNDADNSAFRPEILRCIFNYLSDKKIEHFSELAFNDHYLLERTPELLNLLMEYDDSKSCCDVKLSPNDKSYKSKLLVIHYSKNYTDLLSVKLQDTSSDSDEDKTVLQLIVARLVLIIRNRHSCLLKFCRSNKLDDWRRKCVKERVRMRKTKVSNDLNITFYDALTKSTDKLAVYASNRNFLKAIESSEEKFPAYAKFIKANVELAETRNKFINECFSFMSSLVKKCHKIRISKAEVNQIFKYLSIVDLRRFSAACS
ncbi:uncharacterized protein LOC122505107 [Leptopilina heterotoma]|uniref:uncharacterized protein LOC122505107 n=1 Tax=Leptopilina heterotoma TaxID=63436 RepID=UPI001CA7EC65|nr:uncharacterized protein LOC122505107 [Leptopilina heterotoma]